MLYIFFVLKINCLPLLCIFMYNYSRNFSVNIVRNFGFFHFPGEGGSEEICKIIKIIFFNRKNDAQISKIVLISTPIMRQLC